MANEQRNGRNGLEDEDMRDRMMRDRDDDERFSQRERSWDRDDDRSGWRSTDRGGQGQSGYGAGREGDRSWQSRNQGYAGSNYLAQGGQQTGPQQWGNEMGHGGNRDRNMNYMGHGNYGANQQGPWNQHSGAWNPQGSQWHEQQHQQPDYAGMHSFHGQGQDAGYSNSNYGQGGWNRSNVGMGQPGMGGSYNQGQQGGYGFAMQGGPQHHPQQAQQTHYGQGFGQTGYGGGYGGSYGYGQNQMGQNQMGQNQMGHTSGGMGLGQHGNFRHESYSHLGQHNFGHLGPDSGSNMSRGFSGTSTSMRDDDYSEHPSLGQRIKDWFTGHRGKGPSGYTRSDERIRESVCEVLSDDDRIDATFIEVTVEGGEVTLSGTVENRQAKRMAEDVIENLSGVRDVHNHIRVMDRSRIGGTTGATSSTSSLSSSGMSSSTGGTTTVSGAMKDDRSTTGQNGADKRNRM